MICRLTAFSRIKETSRTAQNLLVGGHAALDQPNRLPCSKIEIDLLAPLDRLNSQLVQSSTNAEPSRKNRQRRKSGGAVSRIF